MNIDRLSNDIDRLRKIIASLENENQIIKAELAEYQEIIKDADCIFCKIVAGKIPTAILYKDEDVIAFPDVNPITPVHLLIVTRKHIPSLAKMDDAEILLIAKMTRVANQLAREQGIAESGYRLTINSGADSGQVVPHLHMHLMGGRTLRWSY